MFKKILLTLFLLLPITGLFSCSSNDKISELSIKINEYSSYLKMIEAETKLHENMPMKKK